MGAPESEAVETGRERIEAAKPGERAAMEGITSGKILGKMGEARGAGAKEGRGGKERRATRIPQERLFHVRKQSLGGEARKYNAVPMSQAVEEATRRCQRRQKQREATARCRSRYSPEKKIAVRKRSTELQRRRRAEMSDEKRNLVRKKDRERKATSGKYQATKIPSHQPEGWWQLHYFQHTYTEVTTPTAKEVHKCGKCGNTFQSMFDQIDHERHGLVGSYYETVECPRLVWINLP